MACCTKGALMKSQLRHFFRLARQFIGLMRSQLCTFRARSILSAFEASELKLLFTKAGWRAQPYSIKFGRGVCLTEEVELRYFLLQQLFHWNSSHRLLMSNLTKIRCTAPNNFDWMATRGAKTFTG